MFWIKYFGFFSGLTFLLLIPILLLTSKSYTTSTFINIIKFLPNSSTVLIALPLLEAVISLEHWMLMYSTDWFDGSTTGASFNTNVIHFPLCTTCMNTTTRITMARVTWLINFATAVIWPWWTVLKNNAKWFSVKI